MSWKKLNTDYTDSIWQGLKKYKQIQNNDDTVSFQDVTEYQNREKSFFSAKSANRMNEALNYIMSMLENGTNLYSGFLDYFKEQKEKFEATGDNKLSEYQTYIDNLKSQTVQSIENAKKSYEDALKNYKAEQKLVFDTWFNVVKDQLSRDQAGKLKLELDKQDKKFTGFISKTTTFNSDGSITELDADGNKLVTVFKSDTLIEQKLYKQNNIPDGEKTIKFEDDKVIEKVVL